MWLGIRAVLKEPGFFFVKDRPKGPPTANRHPHQPPTATNRQPPTVTTAATTNRHQPPITNHQPPPTTTNRHQPPTTSRRQPPTANRHQPWLNTGSARGLFWEISVTEHFFFSGKDRPARDRGTPIGRRSTLSQNCEKKIQGRGHPSQGESLPWANAVNRTACGGDMDVGEGGESTQVPVYQLMPARTRNRHSNQGDGPVSLETA